MSTGAPPPGWWQANDGNWYPPTQQPGWNPSPGFGGWPEGGPPGRSGTKVVAVVVGVLVGVVVLLGIGAAVIVFAVGDTTDEASSRACAIEGTTIRTALEAWRASQSADGMASGTYPESLDVLFGDDGFLVPEGQAGIESRWKYTATPNGGSMILLGTGDCAGFRESA